MSNCMLCKKDVIGNYGTVEWGAQSTDPTSLLLKPHGILLMGDIALCDSCGKKIIAGKITNVIEAAVAFMDQLNSFNDFNHPEVRKRALELQKAVGAMVK